jgi:hypothetical protein
VEGTDAIAPEDVILCWHLSPSIEVVTSLDQEVFFETLLNPFLLLRVLFDGLKLGKN